MSEQYGFTGKQIAELNKMKDWDSVVIRLSGKWQTIEFNGKGATGRRTVQEASVGFDCGTGDFALMYAHQNDTTWQYFVQGLKPTDTVRFVTRENGSELTRERGLKVTELRALIDRYQRNGAIARTYGTTIYREVRDAR